MSNSYVLKSMKEKSTPDAVAALKERIKELSCLYEISNIAATSQESLPDKLQAVVGALPKAWQYPKLAVAELQLDGQSFLSESLPVALLSQKYPIQIREKRRGFLAMHYRKENGRTVSFLGEEAMLLKTLAQEIASIIDRDEQRSREEELRRKFEHADRLTILGELTAGIAHELNTPLGAVLGFAELMEGYIEEPTVRKDLHKIVQSAMHAREVVKKLMFFSCEMPRKMHWQSIHTLIEDALSLLRVSLQSAGLEVKYTVDDEQIRAQVDSVQLTQLIFNLLINAMHASTSGQTIRMGLRKKSDSFELTITDQGHGIPLSVQDRIFEPFFSTKEPGEGSGLGLSVVHGIIKGHHGTITVESRPDIETTFTITLPLTQPV